ncbi:hypothetical protein KQX54_019278 [Cotesia glomerata]|uniref:Uncharacterized protein n=1 Tax=Cotesia glomerata TaxID=32391 RepID=A0AAV7IT71_COTGL|nr:hypothetical protein KQX54_019278 [Cotesia glomerata]
MLNTDEHEPDIKNPEPSVEFSWLWASSLHYLLLTIIEFGVSVNKDLMCGQKQLRCQRRRKRCENCRKSESMNSEEANDDDWTDNNWLFIGLDY